MYEVTIAHRSSTRGIKCLLRRQRTQRDAAGANPVATSNRYALDAYVAQTIDRSLLTLLLQEPEPRCAVFFLKTLHSCFILNLIVGNAQTNMQLFELTAGLSDDIVHLVVQE